MPEVSPKSPPGPAAPAKLLEAVRSRHCPICFLLRQDEFDEMCRWVGGNVADEKNRARLDAAGGFCNHQVWLLSELHSPNSGSKVNDHVAAHLLPRLGVPAGSNGNAPLDWLRRAAAQCPLCEHLREREAAHLRTFVDSLAQGRSWSEYEPSRGLCLPHWLRAQATVGDESFRRRLAQVQAAQIERLQTEMRACVSKLESGRRWEISRDEWAACARTTEKLVGRKGVLPP
jgi:hypothetical protein